MSDWLGDYFFDWSEFGGRAPKIGYSAQLFGVEITVIGKSAESAHLRDEMAGEQFGSHTYKGFHLPLPRLAISLAYEVALKNHTIAYAMKRMRSDANIANARKQGEEAIVLMKELAEYYDLDISDFKLPDFDNLEHSP